MSGINEEDNRRERQEQLASTSKEYGPDWEAHFGPGTFGCHELLDRINLIGDLVEERILGHPTCVLQGGGGGDEGSLITS